MFKEFLMKYFTFLTLILTVFFIGQQGFAQIQSDNTSKSPETNQIANKKDFWDKFEIVGTLLIPISIAIVGGYYSNAQKKIEIREEERSAFQQKISQINAELEEKRFAFELQISQINAQREEDRDFFEQKMVQINTQARQAELLSKLMPALLSKNSRERALGIKVISLALPEECEALVEVLSETDPDERVKSTAKESLKFLKLENLVKNKSELEHLYRIYEGEKQTREIKFKNISSLRAELRHLRSLGLIENKPDMTIGGMSQSGDLRDYVMLTKAGIDHIESREKYGLENPRREKNSEFWS